MSSGFMFGRPQSRKSSADEIRDKDRERKAKPGGGFYRQRMANQTQCRWCGDLFDAYSYAAKHCSPKCRQAAKRARDKAVTHDE